MNRINTVCAIIVFVLCLTAVYLSDHLGIFVKDTGASELVDGLRSFVYDFTLGLLPILTALICVLITNSFWDKLTSDPRRNKSLKKVVNLLVRHQKDERTTNLVTIILKSKEHRENLRQNRRDVVETLISKDKKRNLWTSVRKICDIVREDEVEDFSRLVKELLKRRGLTQTSEDDRFVTLINGDALECMTYVGGPQTWGDILEALKPIFEGVSKGDADEFLLQVEGNSPRPHTFDTSFARRFEYLQVEDGYRSLIYHLRKWLMEREKKSGQ
ncbi:MAG: hypothetical protein QG654_124 [Patescibacteria group bacterium]|nr:hypothetical protein [Patescibacteria group bacterium]